MRAARPTPLAASSVSHSTKTARPSPDHFGRVSCRRARTSAWSPAVAPDQRPHLRDPASSLAPAGKHSSFAERQFLVAQPSPLLTFN